jgi:hypothetical protein
MITMEQARAAQEKVLAGWEDNWTMCGIGLDGDELCISVGLAALPDPNIPLLREVDGVKVVYKQVSMPRFL